ncbi:hypothetical protein AVEN_226343-1 [Araneus ventricosus]|uniref:Uncharacterized protein n=1 Tax=Araneus ventricosus TaxID=182803 RepID=A0A4Y2IM98_ARAVE|nr:hypothetical protein AVEN_226343-1 [Araneus ventricosus]
MGSRSPDKTLKYDRRGDHQYHLSSMKKDNKAPKQQQEEKESSCISRLIRRVRGHNAARNYRRKKSERLRKTQIRHGLDRKGEEGMKTNLSSIRPHISNQKLEFQPPPFSVFVSKRTASTPHTKSIRRTATWLLTQ